MRGGFSYFKLYTNGVKCLHHAYLWEQVQGSISQSTKQKMLLSNFLLSKFQLRIRQTQYTKHNIPVGKRILLCKSCYAQQVNVNSISIKIWPRCQSMSFIKVSVVTFRKSPGLACEGVVRNCLASDSGLFKGWQSMADLQCHTS